MRTVLRVLLAVSPLWLAGCGQPSDMLDCSGHGTARVRDRHAATHPLAGLGAQRPAVEHRQAVDVATIFRMQKN
mgnify:CR=1 FL=1